MAFQGKTAIVTGAGRGIGRSIARALAAHGARVCVSDLDAGLADRVAAEVGGKAVACDVRDPDQIKALVDAAEANLGPVDILVSNAGFARGEPGDAVSASDADWQDSWDVHVMAHVRACRLLLPGMIARRSGHLVQIASAAGLLNQIGDAAYSATKHAAVSLAQSLAITHGDDGIAVSVVCPLYVATPLLGYDDDTPGPVPNDRVLTAEDVARATIEGMAERRFLILPHPEAADYARARMADPDLWIAKMRSVRRRAVKANPDGDWRGLHKLI